ncbi:unnamed protein product [Rotaria magnacalcarata]|uniref:RES domain-containing protein n=1 Tax=Rotaria magnacalcarata TaxID=392030 RepID=A0A819KPC7_9BILA|nr:unnamed protein product [Rotaria magnacalcarata]CAF3952940.1 unnamed protein product [Rotaria magnacalcarata]
MILYRLANRAFADDLSGEGARLYGGRGNQKGQAKLYTAQSRSLATVELLVHLPMAFVPPSLMMITLDVPENASIETVELSGLPKNWQSYPAPAALAQIGGAWLTNNQSLLLQVPSAVVAGDCNYLINPRHALAAQIKITETKAFILDPRLIKSVKK